MKSIITNIAAASLILASLSCDLKDGSVIDVPTSPPIIISSTLSPTAINLGVLPHSSDYFDTTIVVSVSLQDNDGIGDIGSVEYGIYSPENDEIASGTLADNGVAPDLKGNDGIYSSLVPLHLSLTTIGTYTAQIVAVDKGNLYSSTSILPVKVFNADNHAPVISNLTMPDTVAVPTKNTTNYAKIILQVDDQEGLSDIVTVQFSSIRPDGSTVGVYQLYDDGGTVTHEIYAGYSSVSGDLKADDGLYTLTLPIPFGTTGSTYRDFVFHATDQSNASSNIITKRIYLK